MATFYSELKWLHGALDYFGLSRYPNASGPFPSWEGVMDSDGGSSEILAILQH